MYRYSRRTHLPNPYVMYILQSLVGFIIGFGYYKMAVRSPKDFKDRATALAVVWVISALLSVRRFILIDTVHWQLIARFLASITNTFLAFITAVAAGFTGRHIIEKETWK